jgi:uncharacterized Fe-S cluster protein YjdI
MLNNFLIFDNLKTEYSGYRKEIIIIRGTIKICAHSKFIDESS